MLGWVITCHDGRVQEILDALEKKHGAFLQCRAVNFWHGLTSNTLGRMMYDALHETDSGEGVTFSTDITGVPPYHVVSLLNYKHSCCEVIFGVALSLIEQMMAYRETTTSSAPCEHIVELGALEVSSPWHQQQKNPSFVLKHNLCECQPAVLMTLLLQ